MAREARSPASQRCPASVECSQARASLSLSRSRMFGGMFGPAAREPRGSAKEIARVMMSGVDFMR